MKSVWKLLTLTLLCYALTITATLADGNNAKSTKLDAPFSAEDGQGIFLIVTDIHFDPFADPSVVKQLDAAPLWQWTAIFESSQKKGFAQYGSDANYPLMMSAIDAAQSMGLPYDYILYPGDYISHNFKENYQAYAGGDEKAFATFVEKTMRFVGDTMHNSFQNAPILGTLGNNDSICGDYMIAPESPLLEALAPVWGKQAKAPGAFKNFPVGGYYTVPHPTVPNHEIIVLNDIFWSSKYADNCGSDGDDPGAAQLAWLQWTLYRIQKQGLTASLLMHVPPGINAYSSSKGSGDCRSNVTRFWAKQYGDAFLDLTRQFSSVLGDGYTGHTHMDNFRVLSDEAGVPFLFNHITPAVSPIFGNNPAFAIVLYDKKTGGILDYATVYLTNLGETGSGEPAIWSIEYVFSSAYGINSITPETMAKLSQSIRTDPTIRSKYMDYYAAETSENPPITENNWTAFQCAQTKITSEDFAECYCLSQ